MSLSNCENRFGCTGFAIIASIIIGVITALLRITAVITVTPAFLWVVFGIAIAYLAINLLVASWSKKNYCSEKSLPLVLTGILGTVLFSVVLLVVDFVATSIIGAIITGALLFFFSLLITSTLCLVKCLSNYNS